jgi:hypothetical protein
MAKLHDRVSQKAHAEFSGRQRELDTLSSLLEEGGPLVMHVHGVAGIGKSTLLGMFATAARERGARVVSIDCRAVEPTERGFLAELSEALGEPLSSIAAATERLGELGDRVIVTLDTYEVFRLLDAWMRQAFVESLPDVARVAIASRNPPSPSWRTSPGWTALFRSLALEPLAEPDALTYLASAGVAEDVAQSIERVVRGHPLALGMAASLALSQPRKALGDVDLHQVVDELSRLYFDSIPDDTTRHVLEATSVVRRVTEPIVRALLPGIAPRDGLDRLRALPFVESGRDGLFIHDAVRGAIAASLAARDPDAFREYRVAAWTHVRERLARARAGEMWRYTADLFFLLENPVLREGFFPSGPQPLAVEPAIVQDEQPLRAIVAQHGPAELAIHDLWWRHHPDAFHVVRDDEAAVRGYYVMLEAARLHPDVIAIDPLSREWARDHTARGDAAALFCRRLFDRDVGEGACPVQAACWVDIKRAYLETRGRLRWVFMTLRDPSPFAAAAMRLGFRPAATPTLGIGGDTLFSFVLDMGPDSVDGWLGEMVGVDVSARNGEALADHGFLDAAARELVLPTGRVGLTSLEFGVLRYLDERKNQAISRYDLLEAVWGHRNPNSSNVVDVVVRTLRKKLGARANLLETVRGTGYRLRPG